VGIIIINHSEISVTTFPPRYLPLGRWSLQVLRSEVERSASLLEMMALFGTKALDKLGKGFGKKNLGI